MTEIKSGYVQLGDLEIKLGRPPSVTISILVTAAVAKNPLLGMAACLGVCWEAGGVAKPPAKWSDAQYDALRYGEQVLNSLYARNYDLAQVSKAGVAAYHFLGEKLVRQVDIDAAVGNSEDQEEKEA